MYGYDTEDKWKKRNQDHVIILFYVGFYGKLLVKYRKSLNVCKFNVREYEVYLHCNFIYEQ